MDKWEFVASGDKDTGSIGLIYMPNGQILGDVAGYLSVDGETDQEVVDQILKVLNRELPDGKPRKRHRPGPRRVGRRAA